MLRKRKSRQMMPAGLEFMVYTGRECWYSMNAYTVHAVGGGERCRRAAPSCRANALGAKAPGSYFGASAFPGGVDEFSGRVRVSCPGLLRIEAAREHFHHLFSMMSFQRLLALTGEPAPKMIGTPDATSRCRWLWPSRSSTRADATAGRPPISSPRPPSSAMV